LVFFAPLARNASRRHVADRHPDRPAAGLARKPPRHRSTDIDPVDTNAARYERERNSSGPDRQLKRSAVARERGEHVDSPFDLRYVVLPTTPSVVAGCDALAEPPVGRIVDALDHAGTVEALRTTAEIDSSV
jgi:hypothetical protein